MIWLPFGPSHWTCEDYRHIGYIIHARVRKKKNAKSVVDSIKESWVEQVSFNNKKVAEFKNEPHILTAMHKAKTYIEACLEFQEHIAKLQKIKIDEEQRRKIEEELDRLEEQSEAIYRTPIINSTDSN